MCDAGIERSQYVRLREAYATLHRFTAGAALDASTRLALQALALPDPAGFPEAPVGAPAVIQVRTRPRSPG